MTDETKSNRGPAPAPSPLGTEEPWDLVASGYVSDSLPYFQAFARSALSRVNVPPGSRIVDVAAGPGTLSLLAAEAGIDVAAIDFSEQMLAAFRARAEATSLMARIDLRQGDGQRLPFETGVYDAAFSMFGLMFFPDRAAGLREMRRVLRPGAKALISSWVPFDGPFGELLRTAKELIPGFALGGGGKPPLTDPADIQRELEEAGFSAVKVETVIQELTSPSFDAFWDTMQRANAPLVLIRHRLGEDRWNDLAPKIRARVRSTLPTGPLVLGRGAYFGIGTCPA
jgi:SAM-dependent methyltransferase